MPRLNAPAGTDECNFDTDRFPVDVDGTVEVTDDAVAPLLKIGGFTLVDEPDPIPEGTIRLRNADGSGCSFGGIAYEPGADGFVIVPLAAFPDLAGHGFFADGVTVPAVVEPVAEPPIEPTVEPAPEPEAE